MVYSFMQFLHFRLALAVLFDSVSVPIHKFVVCAESARTRTARGKVSTTEKDEWEKNLETGFGKTKVGVKSPETHPRHGKNIAERAYVGLPQFWSQHKTLTLDTCSLPDK